MIFAIIGGVMVYLIVLSILESSSAFDVLFHKK